ncbi:odorant receptor 131-2-like [Chanos chanos]|uniref:Odorant receptor 131-2-like n=1 Tax=Chanos chanos TaxID=29144 RepID=A0A6J2W0K1_CHACN|nr:odorant receptor 131-2-like [Chanos chanos]
MRNTTEFQNATSLKFSGTPAKAFLSMTPCFFFLYVNIVMLFTLRCKAIFQDTSRYILFGHLLFSDSLHLSLSILYYMFAVSKLYFVSYVCLIFVICGEIVTTISPLNLAVMALERYVAICFPLSHAEIATSSRTGIAIIIVWILGSLNAVSELLVYLIYEVPSVSMRVFCSRYTLFQLVIYININTAFIVFYFVTVGIIIVYTYIGIIMAAKSASCDSVSLKRANGTVLLHLIQLGLCLTSTLFSMINTTITWHMDPFAVIQVQYVLFLSLIIFPRCLSSLIYGLRDQAFSGLFKYYFCFGLRSTMKPTVIVN